MPSRLATGSKAIVVAIAGASAPVCRATCVSQKAGSATATRACVPVAQEREDAVVEPVDGRLRQRRRQTKRMPDAVPASAAFVAGLRARNKLAAAKQSATGPMIAAAISQSMPAPSSLPPAGC